jgi:enediyne biosynthesis protein E4
MVLEHSPTPQKHLVESMTGGVAAFDYNGDGRIDLYFVNGAQLPSLEKSAPRFLNRLFRNEGGFKFTDVTTEAGVGGTGYAMGVAAADYDNDGDADLFVAGVNRNLLFRNSGRGTFEDVTAKAGIVSSVWSVAAGWFDYDRDGWLDLFVVNYVRWSPAFDRYCGDRARGIRVYCHPRFFDGLPNTLYRNRGDGTFEDVSRRAGIAQHVGKGMSVAFADYDGDGRQDVFVTNDSVPNFLFRNRADGMFEETGLLAGVSLPAHGRPISAMGVDFRDYDDDGRPDVILTALAGETFPLFRNEGAGVFRDATYASGLGAATIRRSGWGVAIADLDNDGRKDVVTANAHVNDRIEQFEASAYRLPNSLFRNVGAGRFEDVSTGAGADFQQPRAHRGLVAADLNGDGRLDLVTTTLGDSPQIWENVSPAGHWLGVRVVGSPRPRDGLGAVVRVGSQVNVNTSAVGYASSVLAPVHFGLGVAVRIPTIEVTLPSGTKQLVRDVLADQVITVTEARP